MTDVEEEIAVLRQIAEKQEGSSSLYFLVGFSLLETGKPDEALVAFQAADASVRYRHRPAMHFYMGSAFQHAGHSQRAIAEWRGAIEADHARRPQWLWPVTDRVGGVRKARRRLAKNSSRED